MVLLQELSQEEADLENFRDLVFTLVLSLKSQQYLRYISVEESGLEIWRGLYEVEII